MPLTAVLNVDKRALELGHWALRLAALRERDAKFPAPFFKDLDATFLVYKTSGLPLCLCGFPRSPSVWAVFFFFGRDAGSV